MQQLRHFLIDGFILVVAGGPQVLLGYLVWKQQALAAAPGVDGIGRAGVMFLFALSLGNHAWAAMFPSALFPGHKRWA